ncbi:MAG: DnaJ C-terminal domain-containing protein, partial [Candidatus Thermoplasmatota archaeon]
QVRGFTRLITVDSCRRCNGNGKIITVQCKECNGRGKVRAKKKLLVTIPKGCEDNTLLRLRDEADSYILIHVLPHKIFERNGSDLIMTVPISFSQAALGDDIEVQTINGSKAVVKLPPGTQTHTTFILRGKGLPVFGDRGFGNQIVKVVVVTPKKLTQRERELFKELSEIGGEERDRSFFSRFK